MDLPLDTFERYFNKHLYPLEYHWPAKPNAQASLADFKWHTIPGNAVEAIELKRHLSNKWANADDEERKKLAKWIVASWGGVGANKVETLNLHIERALHPGAELPLKGVASYSKILSIVNHTRYAIYDARVAACLNAVQLRMNCERPVFFQYVESRNAIIQHKDKKSGFVNIFSKKELVKNRAWREIKPNETYTTYLDMLHTLKKCYPDTEVYHLEMVLFHQALTLCPQLVNERP